jgi:serine/threonine protein kinase
MKVFKEGEDQIRNELHFLQVVHKIQIVNHPIVEYYGSQMTTKGLCIAMELADCDLLTFWIDKVDRLPADQKFGMGILIFMFVLRALIFLEKLNIVHGDIKLNNFVIVKRNETFCIKIIDFGIVEKIDTRRSLVTVDKTKAHTQIYASPEFTKRDHNGRMSRVLHKKSDAWAAGVMFYFLLFGKMPWKDEYEYDDFANNPNAEDVVIPEKDGCEIIIKLLMKKYPEQRSSAEEALMAMKQEALPSQCVKVFEGKFGSVDDVCSLTVPEEVRVELRRRTV